MLIECIYVILFSLHMYLNFVSMRRPTHYIIIIFFYQLSSIRSLAYKLIRHASRMQPKYSIVIKYNVLNKYFFVIYFLEQNNFKNYNYNAYLTSCINVLKSSNYLSRPPCLGDCFLERQSMRYMSHFCDCQLIVLAL